MLNNIPAPSKPILIGLLVFVVTLFYIFMFNSPWQADSSSYTIVQVVANSINKSEMISKKKTIEMVRGEGEETFDFEGFDNNVSRDPASDRILVPNYIHLVYLNLNEIKFYQCVNIYSIFLNQKPDRIYIHCDKCDFHGYYWQQLVSIDELRAILVINKLNEHGTIFGKQVGWIQHRADVVRIIVLMNFGGIYLDNDVYLVNSLDKYRVYEMTVSWDGDKEAIGNQVLIANRNARFLRAYFDTYRTNYTPGEWYYNAGMVPAKILLRDRYLAHAVRFTLGTHMLIHQLYKINWAEWRTLDTIHLLMGHRSYLDKESPIKEFDENNIKTYPYTYGEMCRTVLDRIKPYLNRSIT